MIAVAMLAISCGIPALRAEVQKAANNQERAPSEEELERKLHSTGTELAQRIPKPRPEDVVSPKAIVTAIHEAISGPPGPFNWDRFRSLFLPDGMIGEAGGKPGEEKVMYLRVSEWIDAVRKARETATVHEVVQKVKVEQFGSIANVFYTHTLGEGTEESERRIGTNLSQLVFDGKRWWVASMVWNGTPQADQVPPEFK
ncbi:hypothetical protein AciPR4_3394 [Terriglobus saanensis SP1PR4]|uniref:DUF4440 domain-containing protein n=2 Tax=Terriglobus saanensis TaxID=870903 RepID=E8UXC4_TERSS|nr:hypothetical protein AciPR4_3394 [Terriglobus saanensis SP1PR4]